jgi:hypothetical protein
VTQGDGRDAKPAAGGARSYLGPVVLDYAPESDGKPDPGEVVWAWVGYEEDPDIGKDRPLVVIGRTGDQADTVVALLLSSQNREGERGWVFLGTGAWDRERRESWVRVDRLLAVPQDGIRREGAVLQRDRFRKLIEAAVTERR